MSIGGFLFVLRRHPERSEGSAGFKTVGLAVVSR